MRARQADGGDATRRRQVGLVPHQPVIRVGLVQVVQDRGPLESCQVFVGAFGLSPYIAERWAAVMGGAPAASGPGTFCAS